MNLKYKIFDKFYLINIFPKNYTLFFFTLSLSVSLSLFFRFRAAPVAHGSSQARGRIGAVAASLHHSHSNAGSKLCLRPAPTAHGNTGSLTHWVRPGIKPSSSCILVGFVSAEPWRELLTWELYALGAAKNQPNKKTLEILLYRDGTPKDCILMVRMN